MVSARSAVQHRLRTRPGNGAEPFIKGALLMIDPESAHADAQCCHVLFGGVDSFAAKIAEGIRKAMREAGLNCDSLDSRCGFGEHRMTLRSNFPSSRDFLQHPRSLTSLIISKLTFELNLNLPDVFRTELEDPRIGEVARWLGSVLKEAAKSTEHPSDSPDDATRSGPSVEETRLFLLARALRELDHRED